MVESRGAFWSYVVRFLGIATLGIMLTGCGCRESGRWYASGETWTCSDGCNICACNNGGLTSTAIGCSDGPGAPPSDGGTTEDAGSPLDATVASPDAMSMPDGSQAPGDAGDTNGLCPEGHTPREAVSLRWCLCDEAYRPLDLTIDDDGLIRSMVPRDAWPDRPVTPELEACYAGTLESDVELRTSCYPTLAGSVVQADSGSCTL